MRYSIQQCFQSVRRVMLGGVYTTTLLYVSTVTLVFVFTQKRCSVYTYKVVVLSAEVNYARGMWACRFFWQALGKHSKFSTMRRRKCNFVWIDVEVMLLLTFLASMKAKVRLYQKCVSVFGSLQVSGFKSLRFEYAFSSFACKTEGQNGDQMFVFVLKTKSCKRRRAHGNQPHPVPHA